MVLTLELESQQTNQTFFPSPTKQDYKLHVLSYTASTTVATVTFKNEASGEYSFYNLKYVAGPPPPRGMLALEAPVRTQTTAKVREGEREERQSVSCMHE